MSKVKIAAAQAYIEAKEYDIAREILHTVGHPTATQLLEQLDQIDPINTNTNPNVTRKIGMAARFKSYVPHIVVTTILYLQFFSQGQ